ncbi:three-Cys-motif partner protein TcmP [bacterium]|nr:three-Cys-motif partner protein TcmP [bacterium]
MSVKRTKFDYVGNWSEKKLKIVEMYTSPYSRILSKNNFYHIYVDEFAGPGQHISSKTFGMIKGSPLLALESKPAFREYHFIEQDRTRIDLLNELAREYDNVTIHQGDCNKIMTKEIIPWLKRHWRRKALCLLDPYKLNYDWEMVYSLGQSGRADVLLNFMISDAQRNVWRNNQSLVDPKQAERLTRAWGDESWREVVFVATEQQDLFDKERIDTAKAKSDAIALAYKERLQRVAGFGYVYKPIPMMNSKHGVIYYLYFASPKAVGVNIIGDIVPKVMTK